MEQPAEKVGLSEVQVELLFELLDNERQKMLDIFRQVRAGELSYPDARIVMGKVSETANQLAAEEMDDDPLAEFINVRPAYRVGPGGTPPALEFDPKKLKRVAEAKLLRSSHHSKHVEHPIQVMPIRIWTWKGFDGQRQ